MPNDMNPRYFPRTTEQKLAYLVEECGEVLAAVGKAQRWGLRSTNPELPPEKRETNAAWILRELPDLERAIALARDGLFAEMGGDEPAAATPPPPGVGELSPVPNVDVCRGCKGTGVCPCGNCTTVPCEDCNGTGSVPSAPDGGEGT